MYERFEEWVQSELLEVLEVPDTKDPGPPSADPLKFWRKIYFCVWEVI
jgi:hypothetical protein